MYVIRYMLEYRDTNSIMNCIATAKYSMECSQKAEWIQLVRLQIASAVDCNHDAVDTTIFQLHAGRTPADLLLGTCDTAAMQLRLLHSSCISNDSLQLLCCSYIYRLECLTFRYVELKRMKCK